jgi:hypothetical protein
MGPQAYASVPGGSVRLLPASARVSRPENEGNQWIATPLEAAMDAASKSTEVWCPSQKPQRGLGMLRAISRGGSGQNKRERLMIETVAFAVVSLALGIPALIGATMLGSKLNLD